MRNSVWPKTCAGVLAGAVLSLVGPGTRLSAQTIDTIVVTIHNIYDRNHNAPRAIAGVGNALHIPTRAWVIRRTLLAKKGDPYDSAKVAESERALRALGIFRAVRIDTVRSNGRLALRVETDDAWSTIPDFDYSAVAGDVLWAVAFTEGNLLGTGTALTGRYEQTPDRHSLSVGYTSTGVLGRRTVLTAQYKTISDGRSGNWSFGVPFYETVAPRALTTS
ncbi:MAG TPA: POTRA domain-containing protein, partial [Gemmatimonadales bacterium]|nr:POTRA domain-containing protein [Gemmatimonadales bacterium]